jgi:hypothetical protein
MRTTSNKTTFARNQKYKHSRQMNVKLCILFHGENSWTVALRQMKFGAVEDHGNSYTFI